MSTTLMLRVQAEGGGWRVLVGAPGHPGEWATLDGAEVAEIEAAAASLARTPKVLIPGRAARRERLEEQVGRRLGRVLDSGPVARLVSGALGAARARAEPVYVLVDSPTLAHMPWELLAWSSRETPIEDGGGDAVVRLEQGRARPAAPAVGEALRALIWCPTPLDPACAAAIEALTATLQEAGVTQRPASPPPPPAVGVVDVLHVVCHGRVVEGDGELLFGDGDRHPGSVSAELAELLPRVALLTLDVCSGASPDADQLSRLAARLLRAGAPACVAAAGTLDLTASVSFSRALYRALSRGEALAPSVLAGRRAVRELAHPHPSARPHLTRLIVPDASTLSHPPPVRLGWRPEGWPRLSPGLAALLGRARELAHQRGRTHVGLEHLVPAQASGAGGRTARSALNILRPPCNGLLDTLESGTWLGDHAGAPEPSPRLIALGASLPLNADVDDLWRALILDPHHGLHALSRGRLAGLLDWGQLVTDTLRLSHEPQPAPPAEAFQVLWGPLDGLVLRPAPGDHIGRHSRNQPVEQPIYKASLATDTGLSRRHLRYLGPGRLLALRPLTHHPGGLLADELRAGEGALQVAVGDVLILSDATWLRALP